VRREIDQKKIRLRGIGGLAKVPTKKKDLWRAGGGVVGKRKKKQPANASIRGSRGNIVGGRGKKRRKGRHNGRFIKSPKNTKR